LRLFSFGGNGLALAALALVVFGAIECPPFEHTSKRHLKPIQRKDFEKIEQKDKLPTLNNSKEFKKNRCFESITNGFGRHVQA